jgi:hypothetical protein
VNQRKDQVVFYSGMQPVAKEEIMFSMQFANTIMEWERRIAFDQEKREHRPNEFSVNDASVQQQPGKMNHSILKKIFGRSQQKTTNSKKSCQDTQPC